VCGSVDWGSIVRSASFKSSKPIPYWADRDEEGSLRCSADCRDRPPLYYHFQGEPPVTIEFDGGTWIRVSHWDFRDGFYPNGWGWGNWSIVDGKLQMEADSAGKESVYLLPVRHGGDFLLEAKVKMVDEFIKAGIAEGLQLD